MRRRLIRWWRKLRGLCALCGDPVPKRKDGDIHTHGPYCRRHNKIFNFGTLYRMSDTKFRSKFSKFSR